MDLGLMVEGVVDIDPSNGRVVLRVLQRDGSWQLLDVQAELEKHNGKEVRLICTPMETIAAVAKMLEGSPMGDLFTLKQ